MVYCQNHLSIQGYYARFASQSSLDLESVGACMFKFMLDVAVWLNNACVDINIVSATKTLAATKELVGESNEIYS